MLQPLLMGLIEKNRETCAFTGTPNGFNSFVPHFSAKRRKWHFLLRACVQLCSKHLIYTKLDLHIKCLSFSTVPANNIPAHNGIPSDHIERSSCAFSLTVTSRDQLWFLDFSRECSQAWNVWTKTNWLMLILSPVEWKQWWVSQENVDWLFRNINL